MTREESKRIRAQFYRALWQGVRLTWPILSGLVMTQALAGLVVGWLEGWGSFAGLYFAFVTGMTVGYGDFAPTRAVTRLLAIGIALLGILLTGLVAALGVRALQATTPFEGGGD
jgi:hypothetical protein